MTAFRTYPHVDMRDTGVRAAQMLARRLPPRRRATAHAERVPFLLPLNAQCTLMGPAASVIGELVAPRNRHDDVELSFAMGFSAADFAECGPVVFGHGSRPRAPARRSRSACTPRWWRGAPSGRSNCSSRATPSRRRSDSRASRGRRS